MPKGNSGQRTADETIVVGVVADPVAEPAQGAEQLAR